MCVWSLSGPLFNGGSGGGRTLCVLSFVLLDNRPLTPPIYELVLLKAAAIIFFCWGWG